MADRYRLDTSTNAIRTDAASPQMMDTTAFGSLLLLAKNIKYYLLTFDASENYYIVDFNNSVWRRFQAAELDEKINERNTNFLLYYEKYDFLRDYGAVGNSVTVESPESNIFYTVNYSAEEEEKLDSLYMPAEPEISFAADSGTSRIFNFQNTAQGNTISYDSLSSMSGITQESITISASTGSASGLITEQTDTISDVGGTISRNRDLENTGVSIEIQGAALSEGISTQTVTTSGY